MPFCHPGSNEYLSNASIAAATVTMGSGDTRARSLCKVSFGLFSLPLLKIVSTTDPYMR